MHTPIYLSGSASAGRGANDRLGLMLQPGNGLHAQAHGWPYWAADNGCYGHYLAGTTFDPLKWCDWLTMLAGLPAWDGWEGLCDPARPARAVDSHLFACLPDVVGDWRATLAVAYPWLDYVRALGFWPAIVAQDGACAADIDWYGIDAVFIGGSTEWKLSDNAARLVHEAKYRGRWVHMGRVNSRLRFQRAAAMGVDSVDGTFLAFAPDQNLPKTLGWLETGQPSLFGSDEYTDTAPGMSPQVLSQTP